MEIDKKEVFLKKKDYIFLSKYFEKRLRRMRVGGFKRTENHKTDIRKVVCEKASINRKIKDIAHRCLKNSHSKLHTLKRFLWKSCESCLTLGNLLYRGALPQVMPFERGSFEYPLNQENLEKREGRQKVKEGQSQILARNLISNFEKKKGLPAFDKHEMRVTLQETEESVTIKKTEMPLFLLALLEEGSEENLKKANALLLQMTPIVNVFSNRFSLKSMVYGNSFDDFSITDLTTVLFKHEHRLSDESKRHLLEKLLLFQGGNFAASAPRSLGFFRESENHMLMKTSAEFLKNEYVCSQNLDKDDLEFNNYHTGLRHRTLSLVSSLIEAGPYEFNSKPYMALTIKALGNLADFATDDEVREKARQALDVIFDLYAMSSLNFCSYGPQRRPVNKSDPESLHNYISIFSAVWLGKTLSIQGSEKLSLSASAMRYRPKKRTMTLCQDKGPAGSSSFYRIGHGYKRSFWNMFSRWSYRSSPEVCFSGKTEENESYNLIAGGVARKGCYAEVQSRVTSLIVGNPQNLEEVFYLGVSIPKVEEGVLAKKDRERHVRALIDSSQDKNKTGVYRNFACGASPVHVPEGSKLEASTTHWKLYKATDGLYVAVYSTPGLGVMALFDLKKPSSEVLQEMLDRIEEKNPHPWNHFEFPDSDGKRGDRLTFDVNSPDSMYVMISCNEEPLNRDFENWPLVTTQLEL